MAEVSAFHVCHSLQEGDGEGEGERGREIEGEREQEREQGSILSAHDDDIYAFDFDPLSPPNISFFIPYSSQSHDFDSYSDTDSESDLSVGPNFVDGQEDHMNFVTDLFASREEEFVVDDQDTVSDPFLGAVGFGEELRLGFGCSIQFDTVAVESDLGDSSAPHEANSTIDGLRVVGFESDSDSEEVIRDFDSGILDDGTAPIGDSVIPLVWGGLGFGEQRARGEELEWEEVDDRVNVRDGLGSVINSIEELSVSSEVSSNQGTSDAAIEDVRNLEWEVLLAVNNLEGAPDSEIDGDNDPVSYLAIRDDYIYAAEYDTLFGQLVQNESRLKGSPPAAKSVVDNLPIVELTKEELQIHNLVCAVCKEEILAMEKVAKLPCCHHYHRDCIIPWLKIRNTCPVCRYELPTDDLDYEQRTTPGNVPRLEHDLQILEFINRVVEGQQIGNVYHALL